MDLVKKLMDEHIDLNDKVIKLENFQDTEKFRELAVSEKQNLAEQMSFMRGYRHVLRRRIDFYLKS